VKIIAEEGFQKKIEQLGAVATSSPSIKNFAQFITDERDRLGALVRLSGAKINQ